MYYSKRLFPFVFFCLILFHFFKAENQPDGCADGEGKQNVLNDFEF